MTVRDKGNLKEEQKMLKVIICCDVDEDISGFDVPAIRFDSYKKKLTWRGIEKNIPKAREICDQVEDCESNTAKVTWFVRSDEQLKIIFDDYAYPLRKYLKLWKKLRHQGDEIGWHPHLWRWSTQKICWYQETLDKKWISHCLENGHKEFIKLQPNLTSITMGWAFHNNFIMKKVNDLGLIVDLSAFPGLKHKGSPDKRGSHFLNAYDWSITLEKPYHPSQPDYRRPPKNNEQSLNILEIPITTAPKSIGRIFVEKMLISSPIDLRKRIIKGVDLHFNSVQHRNAANITNPSFKRIAKQKFKEAKRNKKVHTNLVAIFHPIELFKQKGFQNLQSNLKAIEELSRSSDISFSFLTATEMAKAFLGCQKLGSD